MLVQDEDTETETETSWTYHDRFPEEWAEDHVDGTGPEDCEDCLAFGCMDGVFVGYCSNCALYAYEGRRGRGFVSPGVETDYDIVAEILGHRECFSVFDTYLRDLLQDDITDEDMYGPMITWEDLVYGGDGVMFSHFEGGYNDF